jgi:MtN3 and saliva related transmembrane protein
MHLPSFANSLGTAAAILTSISFVPQVLKILKTRNTSGISLIMYALFVSGVACWLVWGLMLDQKPVVIANAVTLVLSSAVLILKIRAVLLGREGFWD